MASERKVTLKLIGNTSHFDREVDASLKRLASKQASFRASLPQGGGSAKTGLGLDVEGIKAAVTAIDDYKRKIKDFEQATSRLKGMTPAQRKSFLINDKAEIESNLAEYKSYLKRTEQAQIISSRRRLQEAKASSSALENTKRREYQEFVRLEREKQKAASGGGGGFLKDAFGGSFLGSLAGGSIGTIIGQTIGGAASAVSSFIGVAKDLSFAATKIGGDFEVTENSIKVFAGSTRRANEELALIDQTARDTAGLRLVTAEQGFQRLRGLGFEAGRARNLIKELSEEKILSGADDEAMQRVIFNFAQIASGGQKVSQEIRELLTAMPSLRKVFLDAFGALDPKKIQAALDSDPDKFFDSIIASMQKTKGIQGGLNDAQGKFYDQLVRSGREFSKPFLPQLTSSIKELTKDFEDNKETFRDWGKYVSDTLSFVSKIGETKLFTLGKNLADYAERSVLMLSGMSGGANISETGKGVRGYAEYFGVTTKGTNYLTGETAEQKAVKEAEQRAKEAADAQNEALTDAANIAYEQMAKMERQRVQDLTNLGFYYKERFNVIDNALKIEEAQADSRLNLTATAELSSFQYLAAIRQNSLREQIAAQSSFYNKQIALADGDKDKILELTTDKNNKIRDLNVELQVSEFNSLKQVAELERQIFDERRTAAIEFKNLQIRGAQQAAEGQTYEIERAIARQGDLNEKGYAELVAVTQKTFADVSRITREQYDLQLQNQSLTVEQRKNLIKQEYLDTQKAALDNRRALDEIDERRFAAQKQRLTDYTQFVRESYQIQADTVQSLSAFFNPENFNQADVKKLSNVLLKESATNELKDKLKIAEEQMREIQKRKDEFSVYREGTKNDGSLNAEELLNYEKLIKGFNYAEKAAADYRAQIQEIEKDISDRHRNIIEISKSITTENVRAFDEISKQILASRHNLEREDLKSELDLAIKLRNLEQERVGNGKSINPVFQRNVDKLVGAQKKQEIDQQIESIERYNNSLEGLAERLANLRNGDKATLAGLDYNAQQNVLKSQNAEFSRLAQLRAEMNAEIDIGQRLEISRLETILELREREADAIVSIQRSQMELANAQIVSQNQVEASFLSHLAAQKTATEATADLMIGLYEGVATFFDKSIDKTVGKIPLIGDALADFAKAQSRSFITNVTTKLFGIDLEAGKNPVVDRINKSNEYLGQIAFNTANGGGGAGHEGVHGVLSIPGLQQLSGALGSFGGVFNKVIGLFRGGSSGSATTPNFNPNVGAGGGGGGFNFGNLLGKGGMFGAQGFGFNIGTIGGITQIAQMAGGLIGGRAGNVLSTAAMGAQIGSIIPGVGTLLGAAGGALFGLFGGDPKRKADKNENIPALQKGFADAMQQLRDLAANKNAILSDPGGAIAKAQELRNQIGAGFGIQFQSKKYGKIAQTQIASKLTEADSIIAQIKEFAKKAQSAKDLEGSIIGEFASGTYLSSDFLRRNGKLYGGIAGKDSLPSLLMPGEMVLNQMQQARVIAAAGFDPFRFAGVPNYDVPPPPQRTAPRFEPVKMATGGFVGNVAAPMPAPNGGIGGNINLTVNLYEQENGDLLAEIETDRGQKIIAGVVANKYKNGELKLEKR